MTETVYYVIVRLFNRKIVYEGTSLVVAADRLEPGTVYGKGSSLEAAQMAAMIDCAQIESRKLKAESGKQKAED